MLDIFLLKDGSSEWANRDPESPEKEQRLTEVIVKIKIKISP